MGMLQSEEKRVAKKNEAWKAKMATLRKSFSNKQKFDKIYNKRLAANNLLNNKVIGETKNKLSRAKSKLRKLQQRGTVITGGKRRTDESFLQFPYGADKDPK